MRYCFASPHAYGLFDPSSRSVFGGAEVRAWLFGKALARGPDTEVSFLVFHDKLVKRERFGELEVWRHERATPQDWGSLNAVSRYLQRTARFPFVRLLQADWGLPLAIAAHALRAAKKTLSRYLSPAGSISNNGHLYKRAFREVNADIYCVFGASDYAAELLEFCRAEGRKLVLFVSSDEDLSHNYRRDATGRNLYGSRHDLCYRVLIQADLVVTQTAQQQQILKERFNRDSLTIPNPIELDTLDPRFPGFDERQYVLWIGKADVVKRPEILLRLAAEFSGVRFVMVLNRTNAHIFERTIAAATPNVDVREFVPYQDADDLFRSARLLINTSLFEGFPNTLLQAGKFGVPVISLNVDPDGFITQNGCGLVANGDYRRLALGLSTLHNDEDRWRACSENIAAYVKTHHDLRELAGRLRQALTECK